MRVFISTIVFLFAFFSCKSVPQASAEQSLFDIRWEVARIDGVEVKLENNSAFLIFENNEKHTISGYTGCNRMFGSYLLSGNSLSFPPMATTYRGCVGNSVEKEFLSAIARTTNYRISGNTLILLEDEKEIVILLATQQ